jgi:hypothetical protein
MSVFVQQWDFKKIEDWVYISFCLDEFLWNVSYKKRTIQNIAIVLQNYFVIIWAVGTVGVISFKNYSTSMIDLKFLECLDGSQLCILISFMAVKNFIFIFYLKIFSVVFITISAICEPIV